jgi:hypothetical protein
MAIVEFGTGVQDTGPEADVEPLVDRPTRGGGLRQQPRTVGDRAGRHPGGGTGELSAGWAARLTVAWIAIYTVGLLLEPAPANPNATPAVVEAAIGWAFLLAWLVMAVGFTKRRRYGAVSSLVASVFLVGLTIACPVSGHHAGISAWWLFELAGSATLVGLSGRALKRA